MDALPAFDLVRPRTLAELIAARAAHPDSRLLGGGTDLMVNIRRGIVAPPVLIDINSVAELRDIKADAQALEIGAAVTLSELAAHPGVCSTIRWWRRRPAISPARPTATWERSAATSRSTPAASSTIRANGGAKPIIIV